MRLHVHGIGVIGVGFDEPFAKGLGRLEKIPVDRHAPLSLRRRFGRLAKLMYTAAARAIQDAGVKRPEELVLVGATAMGEAAVSLDLLSQIHSSKGVTLSPKLVPNSVHNAPAGHLSIGHGNKKPSLTVSQGWLSVEAGIAAASDLLESPPCERVLVVVGDEVDPAWTERLSRAGAADWATKLESEAFQECAAALVIGLEPGGRALGSIAAGVERVPNDGPSLAEMLRKNDILPGERAEVRVRAGAGGSIIRDVVAQALCRKPEEILLDEPGIGTSQAGSVASLASFLLRGNSGELLLIGREIDEVGFLHYINS